MRWLERFSYERQNCTSGSDLLPPRGKVLLNIIRYYWRKDSKKSRYFLFSKIDIVRVLKECQREMNISYKWSPEALNIFQQHIEDTLLVHLHNAVKCTKILVFLFHYSGTVHAKIK